MHVGEFPLFNVSTRPGRPRRARCASTASTTGLVFHPDNELVRDVVERFPGVYGLVWANPRMPGALDEAAAAARARSGVPRRQAPPAARRLPPRRPVVHPIIELLIERDLPALIHCGHPIFTLPWSIEELIRRYPDARIILGHMGHGNIVYINASIDVAARNPNVYLETSGMPMHAKIREAVERVGARPGPVRLGCAVPSSDGGAREGARERAVRRSWSTGSSARTAGGCSSATAIRTRSIVVAGQGSR